MEILETAELFGIKDIISAKEINTGHINRTFLINCIGGKYILQSLSRKVFKNPEAVMRNISAIESAFEGYSHHVGVPHYIIKDGRNYIETDCEIWRIYKCIEDSETEFKSYLTGYSFGHFIKVIDGIKLEPTIENFHDFSGYIEKLSEFADVPEEISGVYREVKGVFSGVPKRNIHADAKSENLIFSRKTAVIDLDTAMYSYTALDYGDMIRSSCVGGAVNLQSIIDITSGFSHGLGGILSVEEIDSLYYGTLWSACELAVRYLIDFYSGEEYFKGKTREQCRKRGENLADFAKVLKGNEKLLKDIINNSFKNYRNK